MTDPEVTRGSVEYGGTVPLGGQVRGTAVVGPADYQAWTLGRVHEKLDRIEAKLEAQETKARTRIPPWMLLVWLAVGIAIGFEYGWLVFGL